MDKFVSMTQYILKLTLKEKDRNFIGLEIDEKIEDYPQDRRNQMEIISTKLLNSSSENLSLNVRATKSNFDDRFPYN